MESIFSESYIRNHTSEENQITFRFEKKDISYKDDFVELELPSQFKINPHEITEDDFLCIEDYEYAKGEYL